MRSPVRVWRELGPVNFLEALEYAAGGRIRGDCPRAGGQPNSLKPTRCRILWCLSAARLAARRSGTAPARRHLATECNMRSMAISMDKATQTDTIANRAGRERGRHGRKH